MNREKFEALPEIAEALKWCNWCNEYSQYRPIEQYDNHMLNAEFCNGAYYAFL